MKLQGRTRGRARAVGRIALILLGAAAAAAAWSFSPARQQKRRNSALIRDAKAGDVQSVEAALAGGADANARDAHGITALMYAARGERPDIDNPTPTDHPDVVEALVLHGADVNATTPSGFVALFWAARYGHAGAAKVLIAHGADVKAKDKDGITALKSAATNRQTPVVDQLKAAGATE